MWEKSDFCKKVEELFDDDLIVNPDINFYITDLDVECKLYFYTYNWKSEQEVERIEKRLGVYIRRHVSYVPRCMVMVGTHWCYTVTIGENKELARDLISLSLDQVCSKEYGWHRF